MTSTNRRLPPPWSVGAKVSWYWVRRKFGHGYLGQGIIMVFLRSRPGFGRTGHSN